MKDEPVVTRPADLGLPAKFTSYRPGQYEIAEKLAESDKLAYWLDAPPGVGKTVIAVSLQKLTKAKTVFLTRTKQLQKQLLADFPDARALMGRNNYPCLSLVGSTADDCAHGKHACPHHPESDKDEETCPYHVAKRAAIASPLAVLNTAYFLAETSTPHSQFGDRELVVIDEADTLEGELMNFIEVTLDAASLEKLKVAVPSDRGVESWLKHIKDAIIPATGTRIKSLGSQLNLPMGEWTGVEIKMNREAQRLSRFKGKCERFLEEHEQSKWVCIEETTRHGLVWKLKPVTVRPFAFSYFWRHGARFVGMSGTILDASYISSDLGLREQDYGYSEIACPFPAKNRPIYYHPEVNLTRNTMDAELPKLVAAVANIINRYPDKKVLIHTVSNAIRKYLYANLPQERLITHDDKDREAKLAEFKASDRPLVMLSPSFDRGVDLPDDLCRCVIICKVPYLSLGDPQVSERLKMSGGNQWYALKTAQSIVQMTGRGVRHDKDYCDTWILDAQFGRFYASWKRLFPAWWVEAVRRVRFG